MEKEQAFIDRFRAFNRFYAKLLGKFDVEFYGELFTFNEATVTMEIFLQQPISATDISQNLHMNKGQLSKLLKNLEKNGIIQRTPDPADKRTMLLSLTEKGLKRNQAQVEIVRAGLKADCREYSQAEIDRLDQAMAQFLTTYHQTYQVSIAEATPGDYGFVIELHNRVYHQMGYADHFIVHVMHTVSDFIENQPAGKIWVASVNGTKVGVIGLVHHADGTHQIRWFVVDDTYRKLGIGQKLLNRAMQEVKDLGLTEVYLETINELKGARRLYANAGFSMVASSPTTAWKPVELLDEKWIWKK